MHSRYGKRFVIRFLRKGTCKYQVNGLQKHMKAVAWCDPVSSAHDNHCTRTGWGLPQHLCRCSPAPCGNGQASPTTLFLGQNLCSHPLLGCVAMCEVSGQVAQTSALVTCQICFQSCTTCNTRWGKGGCPQQQSQVPVHCWGLAGTPKRPQGFKVSSALPGLLQSSHLHSAQLSEELF